MKGGEISHAGVIREIGAGSVKVEIVSSSACAGCHAAGFCGTSEAVRKEIEVPAEPYAGYEVGEEVEVVLTRALGMKAVLLCYVVPLCVLMILVVSLSYVSGEIVAAVAGVVGLVLYYFALYIMRDRLSGKYVFVIRRKR